MSVQTISVEQYQILLRNSQKNLPAYLIKSMDDLKKNLKNDVQAISLLNFVKEQWENSEDIWYEHFQAASIKGESSRREVRCLTAKGTELKRFACDKANVARVMGLVSGIQGYQKEEFFQWLVSGLKRCIFGAAGVDYYASIGGRMVGYSVKSIEMTWSRYRQPSLLKAQIKRHLASMHKFLQQEQARKERLKNRDTWTKKMKLNPIIEKGILVLNIPEGFSELHLQAVKAAVGEFKSKFDIQVKIIIVPTKTGK